MGQYHIEKARKVAVSLSVQFSTHFYSTSRMHASLMSCTSGCVFLLYVLSYLQYTDTYLNELIVVISLVKFFFALFFFLSLCYRFVW